MQFREAGDFIDCTKMGIGGKAIPPYVDKITDITSDADFIILVEKEAAYMRLAEVLPPLPRSVPPLPPCFPLTWLADVAPSLVFFGSRVRTASTTSTRAL